LAHAWLYDPSDGQVYDPVLDRFYESEAHYGTLFDAVAEVRYSQKEAAVAVAAANHWGFWHRTMPNVLPGPHGPWLTAAMAHKLLNG
jgi:hypothetical protein